MTPRKTAILILALAAIALAVAFPTFALNLLIGLGGACAAVGIYIVVFDAIYDNRWPWEDKQ